MLPMTFEAGTLAAKELKPELDAMKPKPKFKRHLPLPGPSRLLPLARWRTEEEEVFFSKIRKLDRIWEEGKITKRQYENRFTRLENEFHAACDHVAIA